MQNPGTEPIRNVRDVPECGDILSIGDDHGDNSTTFCCRDEAGHENAEEEAHPFHSERTVWGDGTEFTMIWKHKES